MSNMFFLFKTALNSLRHNFLRTLLTILGVIIGLSSVVVVLSVGDGLKDIVIGQVESFGTNIIETEIKVPLAKSKSSGSAEVNSSLSIAMGVAVTTLKLKDMEDINRLSNVKRSYAGMMGQEQVSYRHELRKAFLAGVTSAFIDIDKSEVAKGRFFTDEEDRSLKQVVVLGWDIAEKLFGDQNPLGKSIKIKGKKFRVIGILKKRGAMGFIKFDDYIYIPLRTLQKRLLGVDYVSYMIHELNDVSLSKETAEEIRGVLRRNHHITSPDKDDFRVTTMEEMLEVTSTVTWAITLLLLALTIISLLVGGVGIMNTMLVSVNERITEIGLRKAVGATNKDIRRQFLVESLLISLWGAILGIALGIAVSYFLAVLAHNKLGLDWHFSVNKLSIFLSIGFALLMGIIFGLYPAKVAANLSPVAALRKE